VCIAWKGHPQNNLLSVERDVKPLLPLTPVRLNESMIKGFQNTGILDFG